MGHTFLAGILLSPPVSAMSPVKLVVYDINPRAPRAGTGSPQYFLDVNPCDLISSVKQKILTQEDLKYPLDSFDLKAVSMGFAVMEDSQPMSHYARDGSREIQIMLALD